MIELIFVKELMLTKHENQKIDIFYNFLNNRFKFQSYVYNRCHNLLMLSMNLSNNAILNIKCADYCCNICGISNSEAINLMENTDLTEASGTL